MYRIVTGIWDCLGTLLRLVGYGIRFVSLLVLSRAETAAKIIALESQLIASLIHSEKRLCFSNFFRLLWVFLHPGRLVGGSLPN